VTADQPWWIPPWLVFLGLLIVVGLAYQPAWHGAMLWDDDAHLTRSGLTLWAIWFDVGATQQYYPIVHSAFWVFSRLWGAAPLGYHLVNIALHATSAFLVALMLRRWQVPGALLAAVVFALHPVQVESVAWMTELKNTLSTAFVLGAALAYLRFDQRRDRMSYALSLALFVLALLSKTVTATLPAALLVVFWWKRGRIERRRDVGPLVPFFAAGLAFGVMTAWFERALLHASGTGFDLGLAGRVLLAGRAIWFYLASLVWPNRLTFIYPRWRLDPGDVAQWTYPIALVVALAILWRMRTRTRGPLAVALLFCGLLLPALGVANLYPFRYSFVADHFQYLATIPMIAGLCGALTIAFRPMRRAEPVLMAVLAVPLAALTWQQSHQYSDADTLYRETLARNPACWLCYNNLASTRLHGSPEQLNEALTYLAQAVRLNPGSAEVRNNMGGAFQRLGRLDEALKEHQEAVRLNPALLDARYNVGVVEQKLGRQDEARREYEAVLRAKPDHAAAHHNLATILAREGRVQDAIAHYAAAARLEPDVPASHQGLGVALASVGRIDEAIGEFTAALRLQPADARAHYNLAIVLATSGRLDAALLEFRAAVARDPSSAQFHHDLGAALASAGQLDEASAELRETLRLRPDYPGTREMLQRISSMKGR
jgi:protein O-mannosyl-transferase